MTALRMPASAASVMAWRVMAWGTIRNATSTGSSMSARRGTAGRPWTVALRGLTRWVCSPKPNCTRLLKAVWEKVDLSLAPTRAMLRGRNRLLSRSGVMGDVIVFFPFSFVAGWGFLLVFPLGCALGGEGRHALDRVPAGHELVERGGAGGDRVNRVRDPFGRLHDLKRDPD